MVDMFVWVIWELKLIFEVFALLGNYWGGWNSTPTAYQKCGYLFENLKGFSFSEDFLQNAKENHLLQKDT